MFQPSTAILASGTLESLLRLIDARVAAVARARAVRKTLFVAAIAAVIFGVIALFAEQLVGLAMVAAGVAGIVTCRPAKAPQLKPVQGLSRFLRQLAHELAPGDALTLECDLRHPMAAALALGSGAPVPGSGGRKIARQPYQDAWLNAEARLKDGSLLRWRHQFVCMRVESSRRNPRGKTKRKIKYKARGSYDLTAVLPGKRYLRNANPPPADGPLSEVTEQDGRIRVRVRQTIAAKPSQLAAPLAECDDSAVWLRLAELAFRHVRPISAANPATR